MIEVKADGLEGRFDTILQAEKVAKLEADFAALKGQVLASHRPALDGVKSAGDAAASDPARAAFVERYLRRGLDTGVELKSLTGATDAAGGYPVIEAEDMPDVAADSLSIAFGNFRAGYVIAERTETSILRDPYSNKPYVHFYAVKRIGGAVANSEAIKLMKFAAS